MVSQLDQLYFAIYLLSSSHCTLLYIFYLPLILQSRTSTLRSNETTTPNGPATVDYSEDRAMVSPSTQKDSSNDNGNHGDDREPLSSFVSTNTSSPQMDKVLYSFWQFLFNLGVS